MISSGSTWSGFSLRSESVGAHGQHVENRPGLTMDVVIEEFSRNLRVLQEA